MTPEEWDDERFRQWFVAVSMLVLIVLVLLPVAQMVWGGWTEKQAINLLALDLLAWGLIAPAIYTPWARARRRKRRGERRR